MKRVFVLIAGASLAASTAWAQQHDGTLRTIESTKKIRFGYLETALPFSFAGKNDDPAGFSVELCKRVADGVRQQLGLSELSVAWVPVTARNRFEQVTSGKIDLECGTSTISLSRQKVVDFSIPIWIDGARFVAKADSGIRRLSDLAGRKVAVIKGTSAQLALSQSLQRAYIDTSIIEVQNHLEGMKAVLSGIADAYAADQVILRSLVLATGDDVSYRLSDEPFAFQLYGLVMRRNDADFRQAVNQVLARLYRTGEIADIYAGSLRRLGNPSRLVVEVWALNGLPE